jgi:hypothetical protein
MMKIYLLSVFALHTSLAVVSAVEADIAQTERNLFWDAYVENVDSFPSYAPSPEPSPVPSRKWVS